MGKGAIVTLKHIYRMLFCVNEQVYFKAIRASEDAMHSQKEHLVAHVYVTVIAQRIPTLSE